jgi:hypothetical protein
LSLFKRHIGLRLVVHITAILRETSFHLLQEPMNINVLKTYFMQTANVCEKLTSLPIHTCYKNTNVWKMYIQFNKVIFYYGTYSISCITNFLKRSVKMNLKSIMSYEGNVKLTFIFHIHFAIFTPSNYFIIFKLHRSQMFIFRATWVCIILVLKKNS